MQEHIEKLNNEAMRDKIEELKQQWVSEPCWDIEDTEGFEEHREELLKYHKEMDRQWENRAIERRKIWQEKQYDIYRMGLHETRFVIFDDIRCYISRVSGGWIYTIKDKIENGQPVTSLFIPFNNEFIQED